MKEDIMHSVFRAAGWIQMDDTRDKYHTKGYVEFWEPVYCPPVEVVRISVRGNVQVLS